MEGCKCKPAKSFAQRIIEYQEFVSLVKRMREARKQWEDGDPFDGTEMELAKRMCDAERDVDEYLKKMEECNGVESKLSSLAKPCPNFTPKKK